MRKSGSLVAALVATVLFSAAAHAQQFKSYVGYVYPAGGQIGTTFRVKLGGQGLDGVHGITVSGEGVSGKVVEYFRRLNPQDMTLLSEQMQMLRRSMPPKLFAMASQVGDTSTPMDGNMMMPSEMSSMMGQAKSTGGGAASGNASTKGKDDPAVELVARIRRRMADYTNRPASVAIASLVFAEITISADAKPGRRELRAVTPRGVSNPLVFYVGQVPESSRTAMHTSEVQVPGKEALVQRHRAENDVDHRVSIPCTVNGQISSGEVHRYRFEARKGQRLLLSTLARDLIPFIADAVPGWFQPVLAVYDANGKELAYDDDYRFKPDPVLFFQVPKDGEYVFTITDAIYRGREDFIYRVTLGEMPFVTSIFPLGCRAGMTPKVSMQGWNLSDAVGVPPGKDAAPGLNWFYANKSGIASNRVPFVIDTLPEAFDKEPNNDIAHAQKVVLPVIVNGRIDQSGDWDVYQFTGHADQTIVAEVQARQLESSLDSIIKITDAQGKLLGLNDDHEDLVEAGANTHEADSYLTVKLPADGTYFVHIGDTARAGGPDYAYRLRISEPRPDFALRVSPSYVFLGKFGNTVTVFADRKDGYTGPIKVSLKDPPSGVYAPAVSIGANQLVGRFTISGSNMPPGKLWNLVVQGSAPIGSKTIVREAVPAEDRMQAFLWRHLVPADEFKALAYDPAAAEGMRRSSRRVSIPSSSSSSSSTEKKPDSTTATPPAGKSKFTKSQVAGRLRQLDLLYGDGLLTEEFHRMKVAECEVTQ